MTDDLLEFIYCYSTHPDEFWFIFKTDVYTLLRCSDCGIVYLYMKSNSIHNIIKDLPNY